MRQIVEYLCSPDCLPRTPGRSGGETARRFLFDQLESLHLDPAGDDYYVQELPAIGGANLIARIPGSGVLSGRHVIVGAHYDACDPDGDGLPGASDNAAGVAIVLEVAERVSAMAGTLDRSVLVCLFDAEEPPYFVTPNMGSQWFVDHPTVPLDSIDMMICLDVVGHRLGPAGLPPEVGESIFVLGAELSRGTGRLVDDLPAVDGIRPRRVGNHVVDSMSDYEAFLRIGIPFLFYTTGRNGSYHTPADTPNTLDYHKMEALAQHLTIAVAALSNRSHGDGGFDPAGHDDGATIASIRAVVEPVGTIHPLVGQALDTLVVLATVAERRALTSRERAVISQIVLGVEQVLS